MEIILLKPHHLLDLIRDFGAGQEHQPHPYGHALHLVARRLAAEPGLMVELTAGADEICRPCRHLGPDGRCRDGCAVSGYESSKEAWNRLIDRRLFARLGLREGRRLSALEFCRIAGEGLGELATLYPEEPPEKTAWRGDCLRRGLAEFIAVGESPR